MLTRKNVMLSKIYKSLYSPSNIVHITDLGGGGFFMNTARTNLKLSQKSKEVLSLLKHKKISFWPAALVKKQHKIQYHREITCNREVILSIPKGESVADTGPNTFHEKYSANMFYSSSVSFSCK